MNVARSFNNWRKFRQTVTELGRMSSRELQDLGIDRADIAALPAHRSRANRIVFTTARRPLMTRAFLRQPLLFEIGFLLLLYRVFRLVFLA